VVGMMTIPAMDGSLNNPQELVDSTRSMLALRGTKASMAEVRTQVRYVAHSLKRPGCDAADEPEVPMAVEVTDELLQTLARDLPALHSLCIRAHCGDVTDKGVRTLLELCPKLRWLTLHMAHGVTDQCMPALVNLTHLELHNAVELTDDALRSLRGASLKSLTLSACENVTAAGLSELSTMRQLTSLSLAWCNVTDEVILALSNLPNLTCLSLTHCTPMPGFSGVTDVGARALSGSRLMSLDLSWTGVTDKGAAALMDVATLTHLDVSYTAYGGRGGVTAAEPPQRLA